MATAKEVITDALEDILVTESEAPIEQDEALAAIRYLNDLMTGLDARGMALGFTKVDSLDDLVTVPDGALMGIKAQLSINLAPKFRANISGELVQRARDGMKAISNLAVAGGELQYPSTLPRGSGNTNYDGYQDKFYTDRQRGVLTETGGSIALEEDTEGA